MNSLSSSLEIARRQLCDSYVQENDRLLESDFVVIFYMIETQDQDLPKIGHKKQKRISFFSTVSRFLQHE